jgi:peptidoglycan/LPS O-acetylase OafA/YrhL
VFGRAADQARWPKILLGVVLTLAVAAPTLFIEENWHGKPMIDQPGQLWVIPTIVVAISFAAGGAIGARRITELWQALFHGLIVGTAASAVLLVADVVRRATVHRQLSEGVLRLWVEAALLSIVLASLGGAFSYLRSNRPT